MNNSLTDIQSDIDAVGRIPAVATILEVICRTTGMGFAAVARVTEDRWVACAVRDEISFGLQPGSELKIETTICDEIRRSHQAVVIDHVANDENFVHHHTPAMYGFQSYISVPIMLHDGSFFGTLCAIDPKPARLDNPQIRGMFKLFADLIAFHLNALTQLALTESSLVEERKTAELREEFIAILGHDLRNPVNAVLNGAQLLLRMPLPDQGLRLANIIKNSSYRMNGLIENVLDFARGKMGGGITACLRDNEPLENILTQVIAELGLSWPSRIIKSEMLFSEPVNCDGAKIAQLFSNLLANALTYGKADAPILVKATSDAGLFNLSVSNTGTKISDTAMHRLFKPFSRGEVDRDKQGLGLGLYIASEIARAHRGALEVLSTDEQTRFTLKMPSRESA